MAHARRLMARVSTGTHLTVVVMIRSFLCSLALVAFCASGVAAQWAGILDPTRAIDWSYVGVPGGIPTTRTQCVTSACQTVTGGTVTSASLNAAITSAPNNTYVLIPNGTYTLSSQVTVKSNVTLRGGGAQQTILQCSGDCINVGGGTTFGASTTLVGISSGATRGSTSIVVASASGITVGTYLLVTELNNASAPFYATKTGNEGACSWCDQWGGDRARGQIVEVTSVAGTTIGITPPLYSAYTQTPSVTPFSMTGKYAGLENVQIYITASSVSATADISMHRCAYCWVKGVELNYANGDYLYAGESFRCEIRDSYFSNSLNHESGQTEGSVFLVYKTSGVLVENNIFERSHDSVVMNWGAAGNVVAYNYLHGNFSSGYQTDGGWSINMHGAHPQFNLLEGNVGDMVVPDSTWGSGSHNTLYRNWMQAITERCSLGDGRTTINCASPTYASTQIGGLLVSGLHQTYNVVGNVGGSALAAAHATELGEKIGGSIGDVWTTAVDFAFAIDPNSTTAFPSTLVFGNYRHADSNLTWERNIPSGHNPAHPSQTLPASFYKAAKPAWWGSLAWPSIGPDVTGGTGPGGHASLTASNPAQACYAATSKTGNILNFDAATCYPLGSAPSAPAPPTGPPAPPTGVRIVG